jgi:hypothetical protein
MAAPAAIEVIGDEIGAAAAAVRERTIARRIRGAAETSPIAAVVTLGADVVAATAVCVVGQRGARATALDLVLLTRDGFLIVPEVLLDLAGAQTQ